MLRKALILGMVFIFALSLLAVSMITCFTYDAEADEGNDINNVPAPADPDHGHYHCTQKKPKRTQSELHAPNAGWDCYWYSQ